MTDKKPIGIIADEACDLPKEIIEKYDIGIVPLKVFWPEAENVPGDNIFQKTRELEKRGDKSFAKTSQPSPQDFITIFKEKLEIFEKIICLTITSKHSGTYNSAVQAKRFMGQQGENIEVIDSLNGTSSLGVMIVKLARMIEKGSSFSEVLERARDLIPKSKLYVFLEDPKRLEASGRLSPTLADWIRKLQKVGVRPLIGLKEGKISAIGFKAGAKDIPTALFHQLETKTKEFREKGIKVEIGINHCDNEERAQALKKMIEENLDNSEILFVGIVDDILGAILGPDALGVGWAPAE